MLDFRKKLNWLRISSIESVAFEKETDEFMEHILQGLPSIVKKEDRSRPFIIVITPIDNRRIVADYLNNSTLESEGICSVETYEGNIFSERLFNAIVERFEQEDYEVTMCNDSAYVYVT